MFNRTYRDVNLTLLTALVSMVVCVGMEADTGGNRLTLNLNPAWRFHLGDSDVEPVQADYDDSNWDLASLPHSHRIYDVNLDGFQEGGRDVGWYRRQLTVPKAWQGRRLYLEFQGAMQATTLWVNGRKVGEYAVSGYDSFHFDITPYIKPGRNLIAIRVDNRPNPNLPPDGRKIDYVLFGGLYRDVFLHVTDPVHLTFPWESLKAGVRVTLPEVTKQNAVVEVEATVRNDSGTECACAVESEIRDQSGRTVATMTAQGELGVGRSKTFVLKSDPIRNPHLWSPENPYLYRVVTRVMKGGKECDRIETSLGMRWVRFDKEQGFFLNGEHVKLIGANRHQTWPFIGNAVPNGLHRRDAEQMKEMGINWVRLSHYPHDPDFLDALDELGLMATAEPPTWMWHGSQAWMDNLERSFRRMIRRDRNHPSIILWAACINHRKADERLIQAAVEEDPTRERGQDTVYLPMNFRPGVVSGKGSLTVEHTGHTFPTRRGERVKQTRKDWSINREYEQAQRHWLQTDAAYRLPDNAGLAVWCMYDYNTFHNTDERGLTWHGVADLFRLPKFSYWWHQSELTEEPMAYVVRIDDRHACVFSNGDRVRLFQDVGEGYVRVGEQAPEESYVRDGQRFSYALRHPPFQFIVSAQATALKAEVLVGGSVKATHEWRKAGSPVALVVEADRTEIVADGSDLSRIVVSAVDSSGTVVPDSGIEVTFSIEGNGQLVGENQNRLRDGRTIMLAQSGFGPGALKIRAEATDLDPGETGIRTVSVGDNVDLPEEVADKVPTARSVAEIERRRRNRRGGVRE